MAKVHLVSPQI
uniref:Uncharacterized protein n=1 Tax=Anguilla anguilla TaxID=7936 RepID=A0A0E9SLJ3_ANGAN